MCNSCKERSKSKKCGGCGKHIEQETTNTNFSNEQFEKMKRKSESGGGD